MFRISYFLIIAGNVLVNMNFFVYFGEYYHPLLTFPSKLEYPIWGAPVSMGKSARVIVKFEVCLAPTISVIAICEYELFCWFWRILAPLADFPIETGTPVQYVKLFIHHRPALTLKFHINIVQCSEGGYVSHPHLRPASADVSLINSIFLKLNGPRA